MNPTFDSNFSSESPNYAPCSYLTGQWSYWNTLGDKWRVETRQWPPNAKPSCQDKINTNESYFTDYYNQQYMYDDNNQYTENSYYDQQEAYAPNYSYSRLSDSCGQSEVSPLNSPASTNTMLSFNAYGNSPYSAYVQSMNPNPLEFTMSQIPSQLSVEKFTSVNKNKKYSNLGETWACGM